MRVLDLIIAAFCVVAGVGFILSGDLGLGCLWVVVGGGRLDRLVSA